MGQSIETSDEFPCLGDLVNYNVDPLPTGPGPIMWTLDPVLGNVLDISTGIIAIEFGNEGAATLTAEYGGTTLTRAINIEPSVDALITSTQGFDCQEYNGPPGLVHCLHNVSDVFTASPMGDVSWSSTGAINLSSLSGQSVTGTYTGAGSFSITSNVVSASGCEDEYTYFGVVEEVPDISITNNVYDPDLDINICLDETLIFGLDQNPGSNIIGWRVNGVLIPGNILDYSFSIPGQYTVELLVRTACNCEQVTDVAIVNVDDSPKYNLICRETACAGEEITYTLDLINGAGRDCPNVTWSAINGTVSSTTGSVITVVWDMVTMTTVGQVILTPPASCLGCLEPTVLEVPIVGSVVDVEVDRECTVSFGVLSTAFMTGAIYDWNFTDLTPFGLTTSSTVQVGVMQAPSGEAEVILSYPVGGCQATGRATIYRKPELSVDNTLLCNGQNLSIIFNDAEADKYEASYSIGTVTGDLDFNQGSPIVITMTEVGDLTLRIYDFKYNGAIDPLPACEDVFNIKVLGTDPIVASAITGPREICLGGSSEYTADPFDSDYMWEVSGGTFNGTPSPSMSTTGSTVFVEWGQMPPYQLTVKRIEGGCESDPLVIDVTPLDLSGLTSEIEYLPGFCIDNQDPVIFTLACGTTMSPCQSGTDYDWTIDPPNAGSIVSGQGTSEVGVLWHVTSATMPSITVDYDLCNQAQRVSEIVTLELPGSAGMTIDPAVVCSGSGSTFTLTPNGTLAVDKVDWVLTDRAGSIFENLSSGLTWVFDPADFNSQPVFGTAQVKATVYYDDCSFQDVVFGDVEFLYNPGVEIASFYLGPRCIRGVAQVVDVRLSTPASSSASVGNYTWTRVCGGVTETLGAGPNVNVITVQIDPDVDCDYFLTVDRAYTVGGDIIECSITQAFPLGFDCDSDGCEGICPEITDIINPGPGSAIPKPPGSIEAYLEVGEFVRQATCTPFVDIANDPDIEIRGFTYEVQGVPSVGQFFGSTGGELEQYVDKYTPFETFSYPGLFELVAYVDANYINDQNISVQVCGETTKQVEIPYIPHMDHYLECGMGAEEGKYLLHVEDLTDVLVADKIGLNDYNWEVRPLSGGPLLAFGGSREEVFLINQPPTEIQVEICMSPLSSFEYENFGDSYQVQYCEVITLPAKSNANFVVNDGFPTICVEQDFRFEIIGGVDPDAVYEWDFGDGSSSFNAEPLKVYSLPDTYPVTLTVTNSIGCKVSVTQQIMVTPNVLDGQIGQSPNVCNSRTLLSFIPDAGSAGDPPYNYSWQPFSSTDPQVFVSNTSSVTLIVSDLAGCSKTLNEAIMVNGAFNNSLDLLQSSYCATDDLQFLLSAPTTSTYTYELLLNSTVIDGNFQPNSPSLHVLDLGDATVSPLLILGAGLLNTLSIRVLNGSGDFCEDASVSFEVLAAPDPPVIEADLSCNPAQVSVITLDGSSVNWLVNNSLYQVNSNQLNISPLFTSGAVRAVTVDVNGCSSGLSNFEVIPALNLPNLLSGCITDCADAPPVLSIGFRSFSAWSWNFVPESGPIPMGCNPPTGSGLVQDWVDYLNCGNGHYSLTVRYELLNGEFCDIESEGFCLTCPASSCNGPDWVAENTVCLTSPTGRDLYYINYHARMADGDPGLIACVDGIVVTGGEFIGDIYLDSEGSYFNLEGQVLVDLDEPLNDVCITIPYVEPGGSCASGNYCDVQVVCLGEEDEELDCGLDPCEFEATVGGTSFICPGPTGNSAILGVSLQNVSVPIPAGCNPNKLEVQIHSETGSMSGQVSPGGDRYNLDGTYDASSGRFNISAIGLDLLAYSGQRLFCFRFDVKCNGERVCSASLCIELPEDCTPPDNVVGENPEVYCEGEQDGMDIYFAYIPFEDAMVEDLGEYGLISASFGAHAELGSADPTAAEVLIYAPKGVSGTWILFGNPKVERETIKMTDRNSKDKEIDVLIPQEGDVIRYIRFPDCDDLGKRSSRQSKALEDDVQFEALLSVAPNPAADRITLTGILPESSSLKWGSLRLVGVDGKQYSAASLVQTADRAELLLVNLPPGWYSVSILTDTGQPLQAYFIKQ